mmetsp:Transcript_55925/g.179502  ORF Transcript_55925/g.179502 Transcript_55925/m.179502 type:complete len:219 (+) Transcript_55925:646-1302(+)
MCFSTLGFTKQNQQSACGSITICTSRFFLPPSACRRGRLGSTVSFRPAHSSSSDSSQAACASSGEEKVTQPKPLQGRPSSASSRARRTFRTSPTCRSAFAMLRSSMFGGSRPRKTSSGTTWASSSCSSAPAEAPSISWAQRFREGAPFWPSASSALTTKGQGVVFSGRCIRAASAICAAGLSERPWSQVLPLPLLPTFPSATQRQTWPRPGVWKGARW